jgi:hypothetical protein
MFTRYLQNKKGAVMKNPKCTVCGHTMTDTFECLPCDFVEMAINAGACHANYGEHLAELIGDVMTIRNWSAEPIRYKYPRFA